MFYSAHLSKVTEPLELKRGRLSALSVSQIHNKLNKTKYFVLNLKAINNPSAAESNFIMFSDVAQHLLSNLGLAAVIACMWLQFKSLLVGRWLKYQTTLFGMLMGSGAVISMMAPLTFAPGVIFDLRTTWIVLAGLTSGPLPAFISLAMAGAYRIDMGGAGMAAGLCSMALAGIIGIAVHYKYQRALAQSSASFHWLRLLITAAFTNSILALSPSFLLPLDIALAFLEMTALPFIALSSCSIIAIGWIFSLHQRMLISEGALQRKSLENAQFRTLVECLPECLNLKDVEGRFIIANRQTVDLLGASRLDDVIGKTDFDFHAPKEAAQFKLDEQVVFQSTKAQSFEQMIKAPDGSIRWLSTLKAPFRDENGSVAGIITHNRDISAEYRLRSEIMHVQTLLDSAIGSMNDGFAVFDRDEKLTFYNSRLGEFFPLTADVRVSGTSIIDILRAQCERREIRNGLSIEEVEEIVAAGRSFFKGRQYQQLHSFDGRWIDVVTTKIDGHGWTVIYRDITEQRNLHMQNEWLAFHDPLTKLPNRAYFQQDIVRRYDEFRDQGKIFALILIDLDQFKLVNDTHGHLAGDALLVEIAKRLQQSLRAHDCAVRLGGDEFAILVTLDPQKPQSVDVILDSLTNRIMTGIGVPMRFENIQLIPAASLGFALAENPDEDPSLIMQRADQRMYENKARRKPKALQPSIHS